MKTTSSSKILFTLRLLRNQFRPLCKRSTSFDLDIVLWFALWTQMNVWRIHVHVRSAMVPGFWLNKNILTQQSYVRTFRPLFNKMRRTVPCRFALLVVETMPQNRRVFGTIARRRVLILLLFGSKVKNDVLQIGHIVCVQPLFALSLIRYFNHSIVSERCPSDSITP